MIGMVKINNWSNEQDQIVREMMGITKSKKWIRISQKLQQHTYHRTPSECRERFINYLAPNIDKTQITEEELQIIYEKYEEIGPKWSVIQIFVKSKTQCKIKNVFYGNVKNLLKTVYKFFTFKTAPFINTISTDYLQAIYDGSLQFDGITKAKEGIRAMGYKNNKYALIRHIMSHKEEYLILLNTVLKEVFKQAPVRTNLNDQHERKVMRLLKNQNGSEELRPRHKYTQRVPRSKREPEFSSEESSSSNKIYDYSSPNEAQQSQAPSFPQASEVPCITIKAETKDISIKQQQPASEGVQEHKNDEQLFPFLNYSVEHAPYYYQQAPYIPYGHYYFPQFYPL